MTSEDKRKKKKSIWKIILVVEIMVFIAAALAALYFLVLKKTSAFEFIGRFLSPVEGSKSIKERRIESKKPFALTKNQRYYKQLADPESINVLIIGSDADGTNYDTLLLACIDEENNLVRLINIPRDIYIDYSDEVLERLKKAFPKYTSSKGIFKINATHTIGRLIEYKKDTGRFQNPEFDFTCDIIEEVFGVYIDDFVYMKPDSFARIVDYFGGVDIEVPYRMKYSDPLQNFSVDLEKGFQHLNGKQAEGFVRFRQGYDEKGKFRGIGDLERKKNQINFVKAFLDQHMTLGNIGKIITIAGDLDEYVISSIDRAQETAEYGKLAEKLYRNKFTTESVEIECEETTIEKVYYLKLKTGSK
ncbi:MAG: LCP family protein [Clostridiaceae bacterium]|nr:LCP family protein [Clostridiaceae bacterium]